MAGDLPLSIKSSVAVLCLVDDGQWFQVPRTYLFAHDLCNLISLFLSPDWCFVSCLDCMKCLNCWLTSLFVQGRFIEVDTRRQFGLFGEGEIFQLDASFWYFVWSYLCFRSHKSMDNLFSCSGWSQQTWLKDSRLLLQLCRATDLLRCRSGRVFFEEKMG